MRIETPEGIQNENGFTVHGRLPSLNDYIDACRSHWSNCARFKHQVEEGILWDIKAAKGRGMLRPVGGPVHISFEWHESDHRRDLDNIYSAKKYILDAMQRAGIIVNDNRRCVKGLTDHIVDDTRDFVRVTIKPADMR